MMRLFMIGTLLAALAAGPVFAEACGDPNTPETVLDIGVSDAPPFIILQDGAPPSGLSVELWRRVEMQLIEEGAITGSRFVICESIAEQNRALTSGALDVVLSPLTITPERLSLHDMSRQYFLSGLTVAIPDSGEIAFEHALHVLGSTLIQPGTMRAILLFLFLNLVLAILIRWLLHDARGRATGAADDAAPGGLVGLVDPYIEAVERTLGLKGIGEAGYNVAGRVLEITMAIIGAVLSAALLGVLTSSFVSAIGQTDRMDVSELVAMRVGVVADSTAETYLMSAHQASGDDLSATCRALDDLDGTPTGPGCITAHTITELVNPLLDGTVEVVVGDWAELTYLSRLERYAGDIQVEDMVYLNEPLGWGYGRDTPAMVQKIDAALVTITRDPYWRKLVQQHLGEGSISPD